ncbi:MFS transporter [Enterovibrio norvegicus FF-33]|uniref:MFS transporter n=1 Tax=Enterovibrio norvegicus FF-454 TaxID=1185651 RepID=A0A1E5BZW9_9GAMM|nr:MFS transporter [Enterovibrio norvegicus]OEE58793.1 MFS transporter [Enterovibrio norvegicus FF-454]OEE68065.1 MFS transporter [Enterovibrio norvegicus FF-33]OEE73830.1 MFS transporter [Enterovibrio norvegicus FF-162]
MQQTLEIRTEGNSPLVPVISLSLFAVASGFLMSLIPLALSARGMSVDLASWLASVFYAGLLGGALISARIVGKFGHRNALVAFLIAIVATVGMMATIASPAVWLVSRFLAGVAVAGVFVVIESWLLMADTEKARAKRLGLYMASLYGGSALGQLGIGFFGTEGAMPLMVVATLFSAAMLPPLIFKKGQPKIVEHSSIKLREMRDLPSAAYIGCIVSGLVLGSIYGLLPLDLEQHYSHNQVGMLMAIVILGGMAVQPLVSWLNSRVEKALLMAMFCFAGLLAIAMIEIATVDAGLMAGLFLLGAAAFALYPVAITLACRKVSESKIVAAAELMLLSYSVGSVIGPVLAGKAMNTESGLMFYFAICFAATLIYMLVSTKRNRRRGANGVDDVMPVDL